MPVEKITIVYLKKSQVNYWKRKKKLGGKKRTYRTLRIIRTGKLKMR